MEPPSTRHIHILNESARRLRLEPLRRAIATVLSCHGSSGREVAVLLTTDEAIQELNRNHRHINEPTDVLTFPAGEFSHNLLGDIAIAVPYADRQAHARGVSLAQELGYLAIHGALHLVGFDDETESDRTQMVQEMNRMAGLSGFKPDENWASLLHEEATA
jgi:rRNA maturation RNase YbeY